MDSNQIEPGSKIVVEIQSYVNEFETSFKVPRQLINIFFDNININELKNMYPQTNDPLKLNSIISIPYRYINSIYDFQNAFNNSEDKNSQISEKFKNAIERFVIHDINQNNALKKRVDSITSLKSQIEQIKQLNEEKINRITQEISRDKEQEVQQLKVQISRLQEHMANERINQILDENAKILKINEETTKKNKKLTKEVEDLKKIITSKENEIKSREKLVISKDKQLRTKDTIIEANKKAIEDKDKLIHDLTQKLQFYAELNESNKQKFSDRSIKSNLSQILQILQQINGQNNLEISQLNKENQKLNLIISEKDYQLSILNQEIQGLQRILSQYNFEYLKATDDTVKKILGNT